MIDAGFVWSYIVIAGIVGFFFSTKSAGKAYIVKGLYYFYLAIATLVAIIWSGAAERAVVGFTIAIAIMEGVGCFISGIALMRGNS